MSIRSRRRAVMSHRVWGRIVNISRVEWTRRQFERRRYANRIVSPNSLYQTPQRGPQSCCTHLYTIHLAGGETMRMENQQTPTISASGDVVITRKPDVAYVTLFVTADGILLEDAVNQCASKVDEVQ